MENLKSWIKKMAGGERIEAVVIGKNDEGQTDLKKFLNKVLSWEEASPLLDRDFENYHGPRPCPPAFVWTKSWLILVNEYDGSIWVGKVPRNPQNCKPNYGGL